MPDARLGKEMTMTHNSLNSTETDDIEFTAAYGTAVVMTGTRRATIRSHQPDTLEESSGNMTSQLDIAMVSNQNLGRPHPCPPDDESLKPAPAPVRRLARLAAAPGAGKGRSSQLQRPGDMNRRRKAA
jgi:hypothetical protein